MADSNKKQTSEQVVAKRKTSSAKSSIKTQPSSSQAKKTSSQSKSSQAKKPTSKKTQSQAKKSTSKKTQSQAKSSQAKKSTSKKTSSQSTKTQAKKKPTSKKTSSQSTKTQAMKKPTSKKTSSQSTKVKKKPTSKKTSSQSTKAKKTISKTAKVAAAKSATKKSDTSSKRVKPVKKPARKLDNIEVRNSHAKKNKRKPRIKVVMPKSKSNEPHIYDEAKYLKTLKKQGRRNLKYVTIMFGVLFTLSLLFVFRLEVTHTKNGNDLIKYAQDSYTETTNVESKRGTIYDTNGEALAINLEVYTLRAITDSEYECNTGGQFENCSIEDTEEAANAMAKSLDLDASGRDYILERLNYGVDGGKYEVTFGTAGKNITLSQKKALEKLDYPWLQFDAQELRFYPYGDFASYIVGYTTTDDEGTINGALGVEKALDGHLKGQDGLEVGQFDTYGIELTTEQQSAIPKIDGTDVYLTIDSVIQTYLENSMEKALSADDVKDIDYEGLFTIVMDAKTGDILAAQSLPTFDPNVRKIENYTNYFTDYCFEPGSTFKAATVAAADEAGVWNDTITEPTGERSASTWGGSKIQDWNNAAGWGNITWNQGFYFSSNTVMTYIMDQIPKDFWIDFVTNKLLIGTPVSTQFFETPSCVFNPKYDVEYATSSFGQGITVNVLQLLRMYSALVNDGTMVTPHIVQEVKDSDTGETIYTDEDLEVIENVVSPETSEHIRNLLRGVVTYDDGINQGTGSNYLGSDYDIGMKTGTAQIAGDNGQYLKDLYLYSTMAVAPADDPQILVYTAVIKPEADKYNISYKAFPQYVKEVVDNSLSYLNSENRAVDLEEEVDLPEARNFIGTDIATAEGSRLIKIGTGEVTAQYPKAGQKVSSEQRVILFGTDGLTFPDVTGYTYNETVAVCNQLSVTCQFENTGTRVSEVVNESKNKYKIKME